MNTSFHCLQVFVTKYSTILSSGSDKSWALINDEHYYYIAFTRYKCCFDSENDFLHETYHRSGHLKFECGFVSDSV